MFRFQEGDHAYDLFYSTGQAAIRALCAPGAIEAESTPGGQFRIPKTVLDKLKRDGVPEVPGPLPGDNPPPARPRHGHPALLAEPSDEAVAAADDVVVLENQVRPGGA